jgi:hypothetical protein
MSGGPVAVAWTRQALGQHGWMTVELVDLTPFCCAGCQADWLAAHPDALGPHQHRQLQGWRLLGDPGRPLHETNYDLWCAACGVLIQLGLEEPPCPTFACPPVVINRLPSADGERCSACGRWQQLPTSLLALGGRP